MGPVVRIWGLAALYRSAANVLYSLKLSFSVTMRL